VPPETVARVDKAATEECANSPYVRTDDWLSHATYGELGELDYKCVGPGFPRTSPWTARARCASNGRRYARPRTLGHQKDRLTGWVGAQPMDEFEPAIKALEPK
jgi:hypothetical protein